MKRLHGVHLNHHKNTEQMHSQPIPLPELVRIPLSMHIGAPCTPLVKARDTVTVGQKIGDTDAFMSVPIHSSVSGTVKAVTRYRMSNGRHCDMVEIQTDGLQTVCPEVTPPTVTDQASFLQAVRESGLAGMGGASFPAHVKLAAKQPIDTLAINAAECEPYITSDYRCMIETPDAILDGIRQVLKWLEIPKAVIGIESNKPEAIKLLKEKIGTATDISVYTLPSTYPQGAEKVLIYHTLGRIVQEGQLPADQGVIVMNVSSVAFLSQYLKTGMPMIQRMVTVDGDTIQNKGNFIVPTGTPVEHLLQQAQCDFSATEKVLYGGPMMGIAVPDLQDPILKANNAILAFSKSKPQKETACIHCGTCMQSCPLRLMPTEFEKGLKNKDADLLGKMKITLCMNCGCCTYSCPAKRPVAENNQLAKAFYLNSIKKA